MKKITRWLCVVIAIVLVLPFAVSCSNKASPSNLTPSTTATQDNQNQNDPDNIAPTPIKTDFNGYEFKVLSRLGGMWESFDITASFDGTSVDREVYRRNALLEERYNFIISERKETNFSNVAQTLGAAQEPEYDMWCFMMNAMVPLVQQGYLLNLNEVSGLNLDAPYYDQNTREQGSVADYLFFLTGDLLTMDDLSTTCCVFDMNAWKLSNLEQKYGSLYNLVDNDLWTFEKFKEIVVDAGHDTDGDGTYDFYGAFAQNAHIFNLNVAFGNNILIKDDVSDELYLNRKEKNITDIQNIISFMTSNDVLWGGEEDFLAGKTLFDLTTVCACININSKGIDYGILPNPKRDSEQKEYHSFITTYGSNCITICSTVKDLDTVANIIELASYESMKTVKPELSNYLLGGRIINRPEDSKTLEMVLESKTYELCYLWNVASLYGTFQGLMASKSTDVASALTEANPRVKTAVEKIVQSFVLNS